MRWQQRWGVGLLLGLSLVNSGHAATLVHRWAFDGDLLDSSGSGNHGTATGTIEYVNGAIGRAIVLDDLDDLVENDHAVNLPIGAEAMWSMNVWYNLERFPSLAYGGGFGGRLDNQRVRAFLSFGPAAAHEDNAFYFWGSNIDVYADKPYVTDGDWHMYSVTFDGNFLRMYEDGRQVVETDRDKQGDLLVDDFAARGDLDPIVSVGGPSNWNQQIDGCVDEFAIWDGALSDAEIVDLYQLRGPKIGDYNGNGLLDVEDLDRLSEGVRQATDIGRFDLSNDGKLSELDRYTWITSLRRTWYGDSNLDGEFSSTDFVVVFQAGKFEQDAAAGWSEGDWDGDARFSSSDFVSAFQEGGYEAGPLQATRAVPEPATWSVSIAAAMLACVGTRRRRRS